MRPNKNEYYLNIAAEVAKRSTCLRRQYGAIIVKNDEIIATEKLIISPTANNMKNVYLFTPNKTPLSLLVVRI